MFLNFVLILRAGCMLDFIQRKMQEMRFKFRGIRRFYPVESVRDETKFQGIRMYCMTDSSRTRHLRRAMTLITCCIKNEWFVLIVHFLRITYATHFQSHHAQQIGLLPPPTCSSKDTCHRTASISGRANSLSKPSINGCILPHFLPSLFFNWILWSYPSPLNSSWGNCIWMSSLRRQRFVTITSMPPLAVLLLI